MNVTERVLVAILVPAIAGLLLLLGIYLYRRRAIIAESKNQKEGEQPSNTTQVGFMTEANQQGMGPWQDKYSIEKLKEKRDEVIKLIQAYQTTLGEIQGSVHTITAENRRRTGWEMTLNKTSAGLGVGVTKSIAFASNAFEERNKKAQKWLKKVDETGWDSDLFRKRKDAWETLHKLGKEIEGADKGLFAEKLALAGFAAAEKENADKLGQEMKVWLESQGKKPTNE